jgi:hypothetical protein
LNWIDVDLLRQAGRVFGLAFEAVLILFICLGAGAWLDSTFPRLGLAGVIVGAIVGGAASIYVTVKVSRRLLNESDSGSKEDQGA